MRRTSRQPVTRRNRTAVRWWLRAAGGGCAVRRTVPAGHRQLALLIACLAGLAPPASATTLGVLMPPPAANMQILHDEIEARAQTLGLTVRFAYAPHGAGVQQIEQMRRLIATKVDALVFLPVDVDGFATVTRLAQEADVPLVYVDDGPRVDWIAGRVACVIPNAIAAGRLQMRKLAQMLNGTGRIAILAGDSVHPAAKLRSQGVREVIAAVPGLQIIVEAAGDWDRGEAAAAVSGWIARGLAIDAIVADSDAMAIGAADALKAHGLAAGRVLIGGVGATVDVMTAMQRQQIAVTVHQDPAARGRRAVEDALKLLRREPVQQYDWMPPELITDRMAATHFAK